MRFFKKKINTEKLIKVSHDEAKRYAKNIPEEIQKFLNEQVFRILEYKIYPKYSLFEKLKKEPKFAKSFIAMHNELIKNFPNALGSQSDTINKLKKLGIKPEQFVEVIITGRFLTDIDKSSIVWICLKCRRVIGLIDKIPANLLSNYPILAKWDGVASYLGCYFVAERIVCPNCSSNFWFFHTPYFLVSGLSLQNRINEIKKIRDMEEKKNL